VRSAPYFVGALGFAEGRLDTSSCQRVRFFCSGAMRMPVGRPKSIATSAVMSATVNASPAMNLRTRELSVEPGQPRERVLLAHRAQSGTC